jgi:hypothetical protein
MSDLEKDPNKVPQRTWMGMPVNWDWKNWNKGVWNADDHRLFHQSASASAGPSISMSCCGACGSSDDAAPPSAPCRMS